MADLDHLADQISRLSVREAIQLARKVLGLSGGGHAPVHASVRSDSFSDTYAINLRTFGANKIMAIKLVREVTALGLKEAKDLVEAAPKEVKQGLTLHEAEDLRRRFIEIGCDAEIVRDL